MCGSPCVVNSMIIYIDLSIWHISPYSPVLLGHKQVCLQVCLQAPPPKIEILSRGIVSFVYYNDIDSIDISENI